MNYYSISYSLPYIAFFIFLSLLAIPIGTNKKTAYASFQIYTVFCIFIFFIGFRGYIYTDWGNYYPFYQAVPSLFSSKIVVFDFLSTYSQWNIGFLFYALLCKTISANYFIFQVISFIIDFYILYVFFKMYLSNISLIILAFSFFYIFGGVLGSGIEINLLRNSKAIVIFLLSIRYIENKKFIPFLLLNLLGTAFHTVALLYIPCYFLLNKKLDRKCILFLFIIGNIFYLLNIQWFKEILKIFSEKIQTPLSPLIEIYLSMKKHSGAYGLSIGYLERFFSFIILHRFSHKLIAKNKANQIFINAFYLYSFIYLYCSEMSIILDRVGLLFIFSYWVLYPQIYQLLTKKTKMVFLMIFISYSVMKCFSCDSILFYYENALFPHNTFEQRLLIMETESVDKGFL